MYKSPKINKKFDTSAWDRKLNARTSSLSAKGNIAYVYKVADSSTFRYRCFNMVNALNLEKNSEVRAGYFYHSDIKYLIENLDAFCTLVLVRLEFDSSVATLVSAARLRGIKVFFDIDDLVISPDDIPLIVNTVTTIPNTLETENLIWNYWFSYVGRLRMTMQICDEVIVSTEGLSKLVTEITNKKIHVVPNFMGADQLQISTEIYEEKKRKGFPRTKDLQIGYFSGTPSHNKDFALVQEDISLILESNKNVQLQVVGYLELEKSFLRRFDNRISHTPLTDYINLQSLISKAEINIVPLQSNRFTSAKSVLKYFDAAIVGSLTIASDTGELARSISHGVNGFLCNDQDWHPILNEVISNFDIVSPTILENAYIDAIENYSPAANLELILKVVKN